ncbi:hypothetical protein CW745_07490 [Psychromonas sp. psych-6C06]|uniref:DUF2799 domain-containing protein n=1 Tax=Psychromonas sp. psych-6C06 TaxID=2058089 RepID=UPI000C338A0A|nr:DUF2799 domain-containing protein [Psychromonas sp. psych-6C06]PKF62219.1 hypothetical protein CW745_07490 [Psychromonas sp. psych-6C06]
MIKFYFILPFTLFLFACASTSSQTDTFIASSDWQALGTYDGSEGLPEKSQSTLQELSNRSNGGEVDYKKYQDSYLAAVTIYCKPTNANMLALLGKPYLHACDRFPNGLFFYQDYINALRNNSSR